MHLQPITILPLGRNRRASLYFGREIDCITQEEKELKNKLIVTRTTEHLSNARTS